MSLVSTAPATENPKVLIGSGETSADPLQTPRALYPGAADDQLHRLFLEAASAPSSASIYFPSTAELMMPTAETIRKANPFDLSFGKANRIIGAAAAAAKLGGDSSQPSVSSESSSVHPSTSSSAAETASSFLSKLQLPTSLSSPSIFSNIGLLGGATDGNENSLKTADFARLVQQMKDGGLSTQNSFMGNDSGTSNAPKTADVLNAVIDIHLQQLQQQKEENGGTTTACNLGNYLSAPTSLFNMPTPAGSAPNSAGVLAQLAGPSPQAIASVLASVASINAQQPSPQQLKKLSPKIMLDDATLAAAVAASSANGMLPSTSIVSTVLSTPSSLASHAPMPPAPSTLNPPAPCHSSSSSSLGGGGGSLLTALHHPQAIVDPAAWDPHDVKPIVSGASVVYDHEMMGMGQQSAYHIDDVGGPRSNESCASSTRNSSNGHVSHGGSHHGGRGRGRSTADMPPDERRQTILERNKAAAVRYRKRKKEEHDEMISRCQQMEQERAAIMTQNAVLRREVDRLNAIVKDREARCACLRGVALPAELRERPPGDLEILEQCIGYGSLHGSGAAAAHLMNGLGGAHFGGGQSLPKRMHKQL